MGNHREEKRKTLTSGNLYTQKTKERIFQLCFLCGWKTFTPALAYDSIIGSFILFNNKFWNPTPFLLIFAAQNARACPIILWDFTDHTLILFSLHYNLLLKLISGYTTSLTHTLSRISSQHAAQFPAWRAQHCSLIVTSTECFLSALHMLLFVMTCTFVSVQVVSWPLFCHWSVTRLRPGVRC